MLKISPDISIADDEIELTAIRAQGPGGQNVNKVSSAIHLRFDINTCSLPESYKNRLFDLTDSRINKDGVIIIKAQSFRTREKNRLDALQRLTEIIRSAMRVKKARRPTKATRSSQKKRVDRKVQRGKTKVLRGRVTE